MTNVLKVCCIEGCGKMYGCNIDGKEYLCRDCPFDLEACWLDYTSKPIESHGYCRKHFLDIMSNINRRKSQQFNKGRRRTDGEKAEEEKASKKDGK